MPRYVFNIRKDSHPPDIVEVDLPNLAQARIEGVQLMGMDLKDSPDDFWKDGEWQITVSDERGLVLFTLYSAALRSPATEA